MIWLRLIEGRPVWYVVDERFPVRKDKTGEILMITAWRARFPEYEAMNDRLRARENR